MSDFSIKNILQRGDLTFFASLAVVIIMPVYVKFLPPFMILWGVFWLWENNFKLIKSMFVENKAAILFFLFIGLYLWQIFGLLLADSPGSGIERILKRLSFLVFPLVLFYPGFRIINNIKLLLQIFAISTFLYIIFCFGHAFFNSLSISGGHLVFNPHPEESGWDNFFFSTYFSSPIHPSYLAMYVILSLLISLESVFDRNLSIIQKYLWLSVTLTFMGAIYLLSSRAGYLAAAVVLPLYLLSKTYRKVSGWIILISLLTFLFFSIVIAKTNQRINYTIDELFTGNLTETLETDTRHIIWKSALGVIKQNMIMGVGTGDASRELKKEYTLRGNYSGYYEDLNAHNQYLEILLENGVIGLLIFLCILCYMIFLAFSEKNLVLGLFVIMILIFFFFETILNRIAGITFFSLFSFLLLQNGKSLK